MKKLTIFVFYLLLCVSAIAQQPIPKGQPLLKGTYQTSAYIDSSNKSFEEVWEKVIDVIAENGISIKVIDKTSGIITTETHSFITSFTLEKNGAPKNPDAWIVVRDEGMGNIETLTGNFNIRVKVQEGNTIISIKINNIKANKYMFGTSVPFPAQSTGVFEKLIIESVK